MSFIETIKEKLETIVGEPLNGPEGQYLCIQCEPNKDITDEIKNCWLIDPYNGHRVETSHTDYRHITDYRVKKSIDPTFALFKIAIFMLILLIAIGYFAGKNNFTEILGDTIGTIFGLIIIITLWQIWRSRKAINRK